MRLPVNTAKARLIVWRMAKALLRERIKEARQQKLRLERHYKQTVYVHFLVAPQLLYNWRGGPAGMVAEYTKK